MIQSVHIERFRCVLDLKLELGPLTVLVGPNASGKSTILSALDPTLPAAESDRWQRDRSRPLRRVFTFTTKPLLDLGLGEVSGEAHRYRRLRVEPDHLRQSNHVQRAESLAEKGENLANVFATLTRKEQEALSKQFCELVPVFRDIDVGPHQSGHQWLRFQDRWRPDVWYSPLEVSDGTMLLVAFLTLQYQGAALDVVGIEEPERGLHPYLVGELIKLLRGIATGAIGPRKIQFVLATHSAELLEHVRPEEVRFLDRSRDDGSVKVTTIDPTTDDWQKAFAEYRESLGGVWLSGSLGGVPGAAAAE